MTPYEQARAVFVAEQTATPDGVERILVRARYSRANDRDQWEIDTTWEAGSLRPEIVALAFRAPAGELTPTKLRRLALASIVAAHQEQLHLAAELFTKWKSASEPDRLAGLRLGVAAAPVGGRKGRLLSEAVLAATARVYLDATHRSDSVTEAVADHFGITPSAAGKRIMAARSAGLLPPRQGNSANATKVTRARGRR